jgi:hypothetical protein
MEKLGVTGGKLAMFVELIPVGTGVAKFPAFMPAAGMDALGMPPPVGKPGLAKATFPAKLFGVPIPGWGCTGRPVGATPGAPGKPALLN